MRFLNKYSLIKESFDYNRLILEIRYTKGWKELKKSVRYLSRFYICSGI